jgi:acetoin utilization deacetylase AcuC-like enzyme
MFAVWSDDCERHDPAGEVWLGVWTPGTEVAQRAVEVRDAMAAHGHKLVTAPDKGLDPMLAVHDARFVAYLSTIWHRWVEAGLDRGQPAGGRVVPYHFPLRQAVPALRDNVAVHAEPGRWCIDTMTLIGPGTWEAAPAATWCAAEAADLVTGGEHHVFAVTRPPGHHAGRDFYGGSCYLNNAAVACERLIAGGARRVAIIDLDAHHPNGTQAIFWDRADVLVASTHIDPGAGWFPHWVGHADEHGPHATNLNVVLAPGTAGGEWLAAVDSLVAAVQRFGPDALVLSLGVDAAADDPESPLQVTAAGYQEAGAKLSRVAPTVVVLEGGYVLPTLGSLVAATLVGLEGGE